MDFQQNLERIDFRFKMNKNHDMIIMIEKYCNALWKEFQDEHFYKYKDFLPLEGFLTGERKPIHHPVEGFPPAGRISSRWKEINLPAGRISIHWKDFLILP